MVACYVPHNTLGARASAINKNNLALWIYLSFGEKIVNITNNLLFPKVIKMKQGMGKAKWRVVDSAI